MRLSRPVEAIVDRLAEVGLARTAVAVTILQFALVSVVGMIAVTIGHREPFGGSFENLSFVGTDPLSQLVQPMARWDALWYQHIARSGYSLDGSTAFFPLFPALGALASSLFLGNVAVALVFVACVAYTIALWLLGKLVETETGLEPANERREADGPSGSRRAIVAILCLATFPTAFFFVAGFTESLFLALALGTALLARRGRIGLAGLCAIVATLARIQGIFLAPLILWEGLRQLGLLRRPLPAPSEIPLRPAVVALAAAAAPGITLVAWYAGLTIAFGPTAVGFSAQAPWGQQIVFPWDVILSGFQFIQAQLPQPFALIEVLNLACLFGFGIFAIVGPRLPASFQLYQLPSLVFFSARQMFMLPLMSVSRFALVLFPTYLAAARALVIRPRWLVLWLLVGIVAQILLVQWFARWGFVA